MKLLHARLDSIRECLEVFERYKELAGRGIISSYSGLISSFSLAASCECNFLHKLLLIKAECARVSLILGSTKIFNRNIAQQSNKQDFEEAMDLYETAIRSARTHGFAQYEVLGLELFALFWLTATTRPKEQVASG